MRLHWFVAALFLAVALTYLQSEAILNFLYWRYDWFDNLMHALGGAALGAALVAVLFKRRGARYAVLLALAFVAWEVFEYFAGIPREANYAFDTASDLLMDALGALGIYVIARKTIWRSN